MGASVLLDYIGATVIGSLLLMLLISMNSNSTENMFLFSGDVRVQQTLVSVVETMENDFKRMGYCENQVEMYDKRDQVILYADSNRITFRTDLATSVTNIKGDSNWDIVSYSVGTISDSEVLNTPNPNDIPLIRTVNGVTNNNSAGITKLNFSFYNSSEMLLTTPVANPIEIQRIEINLVVEDPFGYETQTGRDKYAKTFWQQIKMAAKNVSRGNANTFD